MSVDVSVVDVITVLGVLLAPYLMYLALRFYRVMRNESAIIWSQLGEDIALVAFFVTLAYVFYFIGNVSDSPASYLWWLGGDFMVLFTSFSLYRMISSIIEGFREVIG